MLFFILIACNAVSAADDSNNTTQSNNSNINSSTLNTGDSSSNIVISGNVTRCTNGSSFSGVKITVSENGTEIANTTTDENGSYSISFLSNSTVFNVTASYPGHNSSSKEVTVTAEQESASYTTANFQLGQDVVYVRPFTVGDGSGTYDDPYRTIQLALDNVNDGGIIYIMQGSYSGPGNVNLVIEDKSVSIIGLAGPDVTIIDGLGINWIFEIKSTSTKIITVEINNITLKNGNKTTSGESGGAIQAYGTFRTVYLHVKHCNFINNCATQTGGAIYISGQCQTILDHCNFENNSAIMGGAVNNRGTDTKLLITNCTFTNNKADYYNTNGNGGAVNNQGTCTITDSTFTNNSAQSGAIYNGYNGYLTVTGSVFTNNNASTGGGAIETYGKSCTVNNCTFIGNSAGSGGAICIRTNATINCSTFVNNIVTTGGHGGAIYDSSTISRSTVHLCSILNNSGTDVYSDNANVVDATNNWWGNNFEGTNPIAAGRAHNADVNPWVVLTVNADPETIKYLETSIITVDLNHANNGALLVGGTIPDGYVTLNTAWGSFKSSTTTQTISGTTKNGALTVTFYANDLLTSLTNPVKITATKDSYTTGNAYSAFITVQEAVLTITETGPSTVYAGNSVNYTITITNTGPEAAEGVVLTDTMTGISAFNSGTLQYRWKLNNGAWNDWTTYDFNSPLVMNLGTLQNGDIITIEINGTVNASATKGNTIMNTAMATTTTTSGVKTAGVTTTIDTLTDLVVTLTGPATTTAGTQLTYAITVTNNGPSDAQNVQLIDVIPPILENVTHDSFDLGTIAAGASKTITINGTVPSNTANGTIIQNTATVTSDTSGTITPAENVRTTVDTLADVDITKVVDNSRPDVGDTVTFTVTAHNYGPSDATNIQIKDIIPSDFANALINFTKGIYDATTGIWTLNLTSGEEANLTLTGNVTASMAGKNTTNTANKTIQTEADPDTTDSASATIYVPKSDLYITISSSKNNPVIGESVTLTYKLGNNGPDTAKNVAITIPIPIGFHISQITADGNWTYNETNRTITWNFTTVEVGDPYLHLTGWFTATGEYPFTAYISSKTYNTNTRGITPITINAAAPISVSTNVNAKTINMQNTGMPVNYLIIAVILLISGLMIPKKR